MTLTTRRAMWLRVAMTVAIIGNVLVSEARAVDVVELTAQDIQVGLANSDFTITELVESYLQRINKLEPAL